MSEPIRVGSMQLPGCSWSLGCDGYGFHGDGCPRSAKYKQQSTEKRMAKGEWETLNPPERKRTYLYSNGDTLEYKNVSRLKVSESGNHYLDADGVKAIVAPGWRAVELDMDAWTF